MLYHCTRCDRTYTYGTFEYSGTLPVTQVSECSACERGAPSLPAALEEKEEK